MIDIAIPILCLCTNVHITLVGTNYVAVFPSNEWNLAMGNPREPRKPSGNQTRTWCTSQRWRTQTRLRRWLQLPKHGPVSVPDQLSTHHLLAAAWRQPVHQWTVRKKTTSSPASRHSCPCWPWLSVSQPAVGWRGSSWRAGLSGYGPRPQGVGGTRTASWGDRRRAARGQALLTASVLGVFMAVVSHLSLART